MHTLHAAEFRHRHDSCTPASRSGPEVRFDRDADHRRNCDAKERVVAVASRFREDDDGDGTGNDTVSLTVLLTDAPGDFDAAVVTISRVYLQTGTTGDPESGRVMLRTEAVTTDLLTLANDVATLVNDADVPAGTYGQLFFQIEGAYIEVETATGTEIHATPGYSQAPGQVDGELTCAVCGDNAVSVDLQNNLNLGDGSVTLLVDFDVAASFGQPNGDPQEWSLDPSLEAVDVDLAATINVDLGLAAGITLPGLGAFVVELKSVDANDETMGERVEFSDTDGDGVFEASFTNVLPGQYTIDLIMPVGVAVTTNVALPLTVTIAEAADLTQTVMITGVI
jgi:hypothetical protein